MRLDQFISKGTQESGFGNALMSDLRRYKSSPCHWAYLRFVSCSSPHKAIYKSGLLNSIGYSQLRSQRPFVSYIVERDLFFKKEARKDVL